MFKASKFVDPFKIIKEIEIKEGSRVADFGCGTGYFSIPFAKLIGEEGVLYSLDILPQALESVESQAKMNGVSNIITKRANLEKENGSGLEKNSFDWVILKDILFQNKDKAVILKEAHSILKAGGKILVMEWNEAAGSFGPEEGLRLSPENLEGIIKDQGFSIDKKVGAGDFHYVIIASKA